MYGFFGVLVSPLKCFPRKKYAPENPENRYAPENHSRRLYLLWTLYPVFIHFLTHMIDFNLAFSIQPYCFLEELFLNISLIFKLYFGEKHIMFLHVIQKGHTPLWV